MSLMDLLKHIHRAAGGIFLFLLLSYVAAGFLIQNGYLQPVLIFWMRLFDIPLVLTGLLYGVSGLYSQLNQHKSHPTWNAVFIAVSILLFLSVVFLNLAFPTL
ncbi:hypothetical protein IPJ72_01580 [Candidatus Peregrinibacteria bacterium]|nr:MAG: hypothetical protein IPJ72_01580 [Candidatus Peregrinibacteria bacterium]